jgi:hypothetical protein
MVKGRTKNICWMWGVAAMFGLYLASVPPVMADTAPPEAESKMTAAELQGYDKVIALLQEQDSKNSRELRQIKREIAALGQQLESPGIREIMGGIGYILGLFGVAAYVAARKQNTAGGR